MRSQNFSWETQWFSEILKFGVDHKMGRYTGDRFPIITDIWNNNTYFSLLKFHHKVADVMIKPHNGLLAAYAVSEESA
ncbi:MAG: hypothetical protein QM498_03585 [Desulfobacterium sp.]